MVTKRSFSVFDFILISLFLPILIIIFLLLFHIDIDISKFSILSFISNVTLLSFCNIFMGILIDALPFMVLGTFISSIIQISISEEILAKIIPKNKFLGLFFAATIGLVFPVCDCAIVPVVRRLLKKGMPLYIGITFMLSVPIINPIVLASTYYAFSNSISMVFIRGGLGIISAMVIGYFLGSIEGKNKIILEYTGSDYNECLHNHEHHGHHHGDLNCSCAHEHEHHGSHNIFHTISEVIEHTIIETYDVGKYVILGSFLSALMQTFIDRKYIMSIGQNSVLSVIIMMCFAFLLAICSESDAFIARSFAEQFTAGSIISFLLFGPMIDIKNAIMLSGTFKKRFIAKLIFFIFSVCFVIGVSINIIGPGCITNFLAK